MAHMSPHNQLTGTLKAYIAPYGTAEPSLGSTPSGSWIELGPTIESQEIAYEGGLEPFYDNDHQGPVKAVRPQEDLHAIFTVVNLTAENYARILSDASQVVAATGTPDNKKLPHKRGFSPYEYALILRGELDSPYGIFPAHRYIPRCVQSSEPTETRAKDQRAALECDFLALEDDTQASGEELGWIRVATEAV